MTPRHCAYEHYNSHLTIPAESPTFKAAPASTPAQPLLHNTRPPRIFQHPRIPLRRPKQSWRTPICSQKPPDIVAKDIDTADEVPSCSKGTLVDIKFLSPGDVYLDDRTSEIKRSCKRPPGACQRSFPQESQGPRHPAGRGSTRIRRGTERFRPRRVSPGANCWRIWRGIIAHRPPFRCNRGRAAAEHLSYYGDSGSKTAKAYYRRVLYRAWGLTVHRGWARLMLDRRNLVQAPNAPRDQSHHPRARSAYDEKAAYEIYMNLEPGFQSGTGDSIVDAD